MKYGMVIDLTLCIGCYNCQIACKDEYVDNDWLPYSASQPDTDQFWMHVVEKVRGAAPRVKVAYIPTPCMHCSNAPCMAASSGGAVYRRSDGIVLVDPIKSVGQTKIALACPYGAMFINPSTNAAQKCTLCAHLLDAGWKEPRCVEACPVSCIKFGDLDDPNSEVAKLVASGSAKQLHPEYGTDPHVFYIGLPKTFLAGSVISAASKDYVKDAIVVLTDTKGNAISTKTNGFGDFEFEGLNANVMYKLTITKEGMFTKTEMIFLDKDRYLEDIPLFPRGVL